MDTEGKVETEKMNKAIAMAYDVQSKVVEDLVGDTSIRASVTSSVIPGSDVHSAQTRMIEAALRFASVSRIFSPPLLRYSMAVFFSFSKYFAAELSFLLG